MAFSGAIRELLASSVTMCQRTPSDFVTCSYRLLPRYSTVLNGGIDAQIWTTLTPSWETCRPLSSRLSRAFSCHWTIKLKILMSGHISEMLFCFRRIIFSIRYFWCGVEFFSKNLHMLLHPCITPWYVQNGHPSYPSVFFEFEELLLFFHATISAGGYQPETIWQTQINFDILSAPSRSSWLFFLFGFKSQILPVSGPSD